MNIKELEYSVDEYDKTKLILEVSGNNINYCVMNSLRQASIGYIPTYALHPDKITIFKKNDNKKSIYDDTYMKCRLSQLPIRNIDCKVEYLEQQYYKDIDFNNYEKHVDDDFEIEYFLNVKNDKNKMVLDITTDDFIIKVNGKSIKNDLKVPILLIKLRPDEEFECSMKAVLSIGKSNSIFDTCNCYYEKIDDNKFNLVVDSNGQINEYVILKKACDVIINKLKIIEDNLKNNEANIRITDDNVIIIDFENENHMTIGIINYLLQISEKTVDYSGITLYDGFLQNNIRLRLKTKKGISPFKELYKAINNNIDIFKEFQNKIKIYILRHSSKKHFPNLFEILFALSNNIICFHIIQ